MSRVGLTGTEVRAFQAVARELYAESRRAQQDGDVALAADLRRDASRVALNRELLDERRARRRRRAG